MAFNRGPKPERIDGQCALFFKGKAMHFIDEIVLLVMASTACFVVLFAALVGGAAALDAYQCGKYESVTGKPTRYEGLSCYVQDTGNWYAWTEYQHRLATKGEFSK